MIEVDRSRVVPGRVVVRLLHASVDPAMRGWLSAEANDFTGPDGAIMRANVVGEIVKSESALWRVGDFVHGFFGWQTYFAASADPFLWKVDLDLAPAPAWLGSLGLKGLTAWIGLWHLGRSKAGETVLMSTAAGDVGSVVGQLAKADRARAFELTGGPDKTSYGP